MNTLCGAPYHVGDPVLVNGQECTLVEIERKAPQAFGLHWHLIAARCADGAWLRVNVNDDGLNFNTACPVGPSDRIVA